MSEPARDPEFDPERVVIRDKRKLRTEAAGSAEPATASAQPTTASAQPTTASAQPTTASAEPDIAPQETSEDARLLAERTADLQRLQAEFANYRRRADRERLAAGEIAVAGVLSTLLPVLDDLDRARAHGDLTGALKSVADGLDAVLAKAGLQRFGDIGDPFDPTVHEAVLHDVSADVAVPTATTVMRPGYRLGERLVRPAMVGVSDPADAGDLPDAAQPSIADTQRPADIEAPDSDRVGDPAAQAE